MKEVLEHASKTIYRDRQPRLLANLAKERRLNILGKVDAPRRQPVQILRIMGLGVQPHLATRILNGKHYFSTTIAAPAKAPDARRIVGGQIVTPAHGSAVAQRQLLHFFGNYTGAWRRQKEPGRQ